MAQRALRQRSCPHGHEGHDNHLCELVSKRDMLTVANLAKGAKYLCHICGRAAAQPDSLCEPIEI